MTETKNTGDALKVFLDEEYREARVSYPILQFFNYEHLPAPLQIVSKAFHTLAWKMAVELPVCGETTEGLRKLLEAKDCAVRAKIFRADY